MAGKWEYRIERTMGKDWITMSAKLNNLGGEGWELVAFEPDYEGDDGDYVAVFKRPVSDRHG
jgi:hypothetical protein